MWLPGHFAVAFIVCLPLVVLARRDRPLALVFITFFSLLPDLMHLGELRTISHSIVGLSFLLLVTLSLLWALFQPRAGLLVIGVLAAFSHIAVDTVLGSGYLFYPIDRTLIVVAPVSQAMDLQVETMVMALIVIPLILCLLPGSTMRSMRDLTLKQRWNAVVLWIIFAAVTALEGGYFFLESFHFGSVARPLLILAFILLLAWAIVMVLITLATEPIGLEDHAPYAHSRST